ncbi:hypothetical protein TRFO_02334 [Tritrichomonas foetus]|uniref:Uncharacterized protein n=1 Tax=Tritrichomonas foetus TaxID=1144522 RepID=A0A1J4J6L6_9EUKA|nr:hypothetical protein TRFO_02334 [Tritrichomonas foetus]|eukprot:OHS93815.1 hypothetical protein TRFO_02334 [Tritrichomonas foetus]
MNKDQKKDLVDRLANLKDILSNKSYASQIRPFKIGILSIKNNKIVKNSRKPNTKNTNPKNVHKIHEQKLSNAVTSPIKAPTFNMPTITDSEEEDEDNNVLYEYSDDSYCDKKEKTAQLLNPTQIKSTPRMFLIQKYFRHWRRALRSKQLQTTIDKKINKCPKEVEKERIQFRRMKAKMEVQRKPPRKLTRAEKEEILERLTRPTRTQERITHEIKKNQEMLEIEHYRPKNEEEKKKIMRRKYVRKITNERDHSKNKRFTRLSKKDIEESVNRLSQPKTQPQTEIKSKSYMTLQEQQESVNRLSEPKVYKEEPIRRTNKYSLPTKQEQLDISIRLSQPKPEFTESPTLKKSKLSPTEKSQFYERLSTPRKVIVKSDEIKENNENVDPTQDNSKNSKSQKKGNKRNKNVNKNHGHNSTKKKKGKSRRKKGKSISELLKINTGQEIVNTKTDNSGVIIQSPKVGLETPKSERKVRFNGVQSSSKKNGLSLSRQMNDILDDSNLSESEVYTNSPIQTPTPIKMKPNIPELDKYALPSMSDSKRKESNEYDTDEISDLEDISEIDINRTSEHNSQMLHRTPLSRQESTTTSSIDIEYLFEGTGL